MEQDRSGGDAEPKPEGLREKLDRAHAEREKDMRELAERLKPTDAARSLLWGDIVKPTVPHGCHSALVGQAMFLRSYLASIAQGAKS